jgi:hypothetical protein
VLVPSKCCGECEHRTLANVIAVSKFQVANVQGALGCHAVDCLPCEPATPNPWIGVTCRNSRCVAFDARQEDITECATHDDCRLRGGIACCEKCTAAGPEFVSVNPSVNPQQLLCGNSAMGCTGCVAVPPPGLSAVCEGGRCSLAQAVEP